MKINKETIARTVVLFVALINQMLILFGKNPLPFANDDIFMAISAVVTVAATVWAWWKNNSFTQSAMKADEYMKELKKEEDSKEGE